MIDQPREQMAASGPSRRFWNVRALVAVGVEADIQPATLTNLGLRVHGLD
jgi:hypothetical protein